MSDQYLSEIRIMPYSFAPQYWALCNGQILGISQNSALFALLGTTYGGNGINTFALPNLQGRVPLHVGNGFNLGTTAGEETHTLTTAEIPAHVHTIKVNDTVASTAIPDAALTPGQAQSTASGTPAVNIYAPYANDQLPLNPAELSLAGNNAAHENRQPYLVLHFCISMSGIYPSPN